MEPLNFKKFIEAAFENDGTGNTFWSGSKGASGILPICQNTKRICFAWRSRQVHMGSCWGTIGGAIDEGLTPESSAIKELKEETGYAGSVHTMPAFVFTSGKFRYYNFIGIVDSEFGLNPIKGHSWETDSLEWFTLDEAKQQLNRAHPGLVALFKNSYDIIVKATGAAQEPFL